MQRLACEPVDCAWDELLFDVLAELVVEFELGFEFFVDLLLLIVSWWLRWVEEVEE